MKTMIKGSKKMSVYLNSNDYFYIKTLEKKFDQKIKLIKNYRSCIQHLNQILIRSNSMHTDYLPDLTSDPVGKTSWTKEKPM